MEGNLHKRISPRNALHPPEMLYTPPQRHLAPPPKSFCTPANYIYFDLIFSYLIILTTKFVKLPILWFQILPCRPRKQILLNFVPGLSGCCHQAPTKARSSSTPRYLSTTPPPPKRKYENLSVLECHCLPFICFCFKVGPTLSGPFELACSCRSVIVVCCIHIVYKLYTSTRARNNGRSTDNVQPECGVVR